MVPPLPHRLALECVSRVLFYRLSAYADLPPRFRGLAVVFAEGVPEVPEQDITTSA